MTEAPTVAYIARLTETRTHRAADGASRRATLCWTLSRDRDGRTRAELSLPVAGEPFGVAILTDPRRHKVILVNAASGAAITEQDLKRVGDPFPQFPAGTSVNAPPPPSRGAAQVEDLGTAELEGIKCRGRRLTFEDGTVEHWSAIDAWIDQNVVTRMHTDTDDYEARLSDVQLTDPDPGLFAPLDVS